MTHCIRLHLFLLSKRDLFSCGVCQKGPTLPLLLVTLHDIESPLSQGQLCGPYAHPQPGDLSALTLWSTGNPLEALSPGSFCSVPLAPVALA